MDKCPKCESSNLKVYVGFLLGSKVFIIECEDCGFEGFTESPF
jgi:predicted nucleic-acid-binding Zn-ribbon protein